MGTSRYHFTANDETEGPFETETEAKAAAATMLDRGATYSLWVTGQGTRGLGKRLGYFKTPDDSNLDLTPTVDDT